jgi:predicted ester cyclase
MPTSDVKEKFYRSVFEAWNNGNLEAMDEVYADDFVFHRHSEPDIVNLTSYKKFIATVRNAHPGSRFLFDDIILDGNKSACVMTDRDELRECIVSRWVGNRIVEEWQCPDCLA